jgi:carbamoyl-phosphate synthase large subunit
VEMQSTGEVACFGPTFADALVKALVAAGVKLVPKRGRAFLSVGGTELKQAILPAVERLHALGFQLSATEDTAAFLKDRGFERVQVLHKVSEPDRHPNVLEALDNGEIDLMLNVPSSLTQEKLERMLEDEYVLRRRTVELGVPLFTNPEAFVAYIEGMQWIEEHPLTIQPLYGSPEPAKLAESRATRAVPLLSPRRRRPTRRRA